jgi:disease resistance protein
MSRDGKFMCANKGCTKKSFVPEENNDQACNYHTGEPVFHDLKKSWSCCGKVTYDWDDFMKLPTCAVSSHQMKYK